MSKRKRFGTAFVLFFLFCAIGLPYHHLAQGFDDPPDYDGEPMTPPQAFTVGVGIAGIAVGPPDSISWEDVNGNTHTAACSTIAAQLGNELRNGDIQQEILNDDASGWEYQGQININDDVLNDALQSDDALDHLREILIHEWVHKQQEGDEEFLRCWICSGNEVEATDAELAYKDSIGIPSYDLNYIFAVNYKFTHLLNYIMGLLFEDHLGRIIVDGRRWILEIHPDEPPAPDLLLAYRSGDSTAQELSLDPLRCTDFRVIQHYFPNGNPLLVACGFVPNVGGRLQTYEVSDSGIAVPFSTLDFNPYFYAIERADFDNSYIVLDTVTTQLYRLEDTDGDAVPDQIVGVFASATEYPELMEVRSVKAAIHPVYGIGLIVNPEPARHFHVIRPYDTRWFLVDSDGDHVADACFSVRRCEFMRVIPQIREIPYAGDMMATVFGTWDHDIAVYATDETGEILLENLGVVHLADSVKVACPLVRSLEAGEYIIPVDLVSGERSARPQPVRDITPVGLVILFDAELGLMQLSWEPVPGAIEYALWVSDDGEEFSDTGLRTATANFEMPLPPLEQQFYRVTAIR